MLVSRADVRFVNRLLLDGRQRVAIFFPWRFVLSQLGISSMLGTFRIGPGPRDRHFPVMARHKGVLHLLYPSQTLGRWATHTSRARPKRRDDRADCQGVKKADVQPEPDGGKKIGPDGLEKWRRLLNDKSQNDPISLTPRHVQSARTFLLAIFTFHRSGLRQFRRRPRRPRSLPGDGVSLKKKNEPDETVAAFSVAVQFATFSKTPALVFGWRT